MIFKGEYKNWKIWKGFAKKYTDNNPIYNGTFNKGIFWEGIAKEFNEKKDLIFNGEYWGGYKCKGKSYKYD